jgi:hypothetical protein
VIYRLAINMWEKIKQVHLLGIILVNVKGYHGKGILLAVL